MLTFPLLDFCRLARNIYGSDALRLRTSAKCRRESFHSRHGWRGCTFRFFCNPCWSACRQCNEAGFSIEDPEAVFAVGKRTKSASYGYIRAKRIGFKSVFIPASKVFIQSGHYSFYFQYEKPGDGPGMVTPIWPDVEPEEEVDGLHTRMTLYLHDKGSPDEIKYLQDTVLKQLNDPRQTYLLFLRKLKRINAAFYDESGS